MIISDDFINNLIMTAWLFYEEDEERSIDPMPYASIIDVILNCLEFYSNQLEIGYDIKKIVNMSKMICMIKSEIHKDKDVVILDLLLKLFNKHTNLYYKYRS